MLCGEVDIGKRFVYSANWINKEEDCPCEYAIPNDVYTVMTKDGYILTGNGGYSGFNKKNEIWYVPTVIKDKDLPDGGTNDRYHYGK